MDKDDWKYIAIFTGASSAILLGATIVTGYSFVDVRSRLNKKLEITQNEIIEIKKEQEKLVPKVGELETKVNYVEAEIGKPLGYVVVSDFNNDGYLDRLIPRTNGNFKVEINDGNGNYSNATEFDVKMLRDVLEDYLFYAGNKVKPEYVRHTYMINPATFCGIQKLAKDSPLMTQSNKQIFDDAYKKLNTEYRFDKKIKCT